MYKHWNLPEIGDHLISRKAPAFKAAFPQAQGPGITGKKGGIHAAHGSRINIVQHVIAHIQGGSRGYFY
jgi:hypothetical protein